PWAFSNNNLNQINELRLGESILLGRDPISGNPIQGLYTDAFTLISEVIESKRKPELIKTPSAKIISNYLKKNDQVILAIGNQDTDANSLVFPNGFTFVGATSDHLVLNTSNLKLNIGAECRMKMDYNSLMKVMNSPTVEKKYL
ncbi:MAG: alanine/ornithine racemase family PLP-dependent enzyme, partial [SAR324 cluster bacterium]|nr:alanine/ornithine racemase family PLP-dependent enzyme [SAR324 cluster bacterium]